MKFSGTLSVTVYGLLIVLSLLSGVGVTPAAAISMSGSVANSAGSPVSGVFIEQVESPLVNTASDGAGNFVLSGLPSGVTFSVKLSQSGFLPVYSANSNSTSDITAANFRLFTAVEVSSWGVASGKGVIRGRVTENNSLVSISGAIVSCTSMLHPGACPYTIKYYDGATYGGSSTYANGVYLVVNVDDGDLVTVTASKNGWNFNSKTFLTHADAVSQRSIQGTPTGSISGTVSYSGSKTGTIFVALLSSPLITPGVTAPLYYTALSSPGAYIINGVSDGSYYVAAIRTNDVAHIQMTDPHGMYGIDFISDFTADPVVVSNGGPTGGASFKIVDGSAKYPNPFYAGTQSVKVQLACPASVKVGQPLTVTVNLFNWECYDLMLVDRFMMMVIGNTDGTLGGLGLFGPFNRQLNTPKEVPPAVCGLTTTPGTVSPFKLTIMSAVPASLSGKMATANIEAVTTKGQTFGGGECSVKVVP